MRSRCQYHCGGCGSHFASLSAFDAHRAGSYQEGRHCLDPMDDGRFRLKTEGGVCDNRPPYPSGVRIWQLVKDVERAVSHWGGRVSRPSRVEPTETRGRAA